MTQWYYSDYERNRLGPVAARDLADLHEAGQLQPDTLVWHEGLPQWQPWRELMNHALNEAAGAPTPAVEAVPLSAGVNPTPWPNRRFPRPPARARRRRSRRGVNPYALAEPHSPYAPPRATLQQRRRLRRRR